MIEPALPRPRPRTSSALTLCPPAEDDRPRERLRSLGPVALSDAELLALVLGTGVRGEPVERLALRILRNHGGARGLLRASLAELGVDLGPARAARIRGAFELARRGLAEPLPNPARFLTAADVLRTYGPRLNDRAEETVLVVLLDVKGRPVVERELAHGTASFCPVSARMVFGLAVREGGSSLLLVHNHPSGDPQPSRADAEMTDAVERAGRLLDMPLVDHVIVASGGAFSFRESGWFERRPAST